MLRAVEHDNPNPQVFTSRCKCRGGLILIESRVPATALMAEFSLAQRHVLDGIQESKFSYCTEFGTIKAL